MKSEVQSRKMELRISKAKITIINIKKSILNTQPFRYILHLTNRNNSIPGILKISDLKLAVQSVYFVLHASEAGKEVGVIH